jgi:hypothetical protein
VQTLLHLRLQAEEEVVNKKVLRRLGAWQHTRPHIVIALQGHQFIKNGTICLGRDSPIVEHYS